jgi:flagellin
VSRPKIRNFKMALAIATNNAALNAAASASSVNRDMETSMARLSSGKRINSASDDAAGVAISSRLSAEIRGTDQSIRNSLDGQALIDTAEGAHKEIENILQRMREVAVQAANDTNNDQDRHNLQAEIDALVTEINRIASTTTWAGEKLMEAELGTDFSFQVGAKTAAENQISIKINGMGSHALGLKADTSDVAHTLSDVAVGQSDNTVDYAPPFEIRQGAISAGGVVTPNNGNTSITLIGLGASFADVTYTTTDPTSVNDAVDAINAGTAGTNISATVGADGGDNPGQIILKHNAANDILPDGSTFSTAGEGIGAHLSLTTVYTAYDTANSDPAATVAVDGDEGTINFHEDAGASFKLVLARDDTTGAPATNSEFTIDTTADLQTAVDAINDGAGTANSGDGTTEHGYHAEIVAAADGSPVNGTIKLTKIDGGTATQTSFANLDLGAVGHDSKTVTSDDGSFVVVEATETAAKHGVFTPGDVNTTGTVSITLAGEALTVEGISDKGTDAAGDAAKIAEAINASSHGYTAEAMTGADAGKVKITQPAAPAQDMDVKTLPKALEAIVAVDEAIKTVNIQRSTLGAVSNRLSHTINNLTNISTNLSAAQGGIEDADFAHETTMLAKNQILQQASTAMLAQANASKQNVLSLLQG